MAKTPGQQARDALAALEQEKAVFGGMARRGAIDAFQRIEAVASNPRFLDDDKMLGKYLAANIWICEQAYGKATQRQELTGEGGGPAQIVVNVVTKATTGE